MLENETHWGPFQYHCKKFTLILTLLTNNWLYGLIFGPQTNILQKKKKKNGSGQNLFISLVCNVDILT